MTRSRDLAGFGGARCIFHRLSTMLVYALKGRSQLGWLVGLPDLSPSTLSLVCLL